MTGGPIRVREAVQADAEGVAALFVQCVGGGLDEHRRGYIGELARAGDGRLVLVAEAAGGIIGLARARRLDPAPHPTADSAPAGWYLLGVVVLPTHRRQGAGSELTRERLRWIAERADEAFYFTGSDNHASIALHERFGFREVGRGVAYPGADSSARAKRVLYRVRFDEVEP